MRRLALTTLAASVITAAAPPRHAGAQSAGEASEARRAVRRANAAWARGDWERAQRGYAAAWQISRAPRLARRLALVHERLDEPHLAASWYARYLAARQRAGSPPTSEQRARLARLQALRPTSGLLSVRAEPRGAVIYVDGAPITSRTVRVRAGDRRIVIEAPGYNARTDLVRVPARAQIERSYKLEPLAASPPEPPPRVMPEVAAPRPGPLARVTLVDASTPIGAQIGAWSLITPGTAAILIAALIAISEDDAGNVPLYVGAGGASFVGAGVYLLAGYSWGLRTAEVAHPAGEPRARSGGAD